MEANNLLTRQFVFFPIAHSEKSLRDERMNSFMNPRQRPTFPCCPSGAARHNAIRENGKNPHAVALGKMTSSKKAAAAQENGAKGGRPEGS